MTRRLLTVALALTMTLAAVGGASADIVPLSPTPIVTPSATPGMALYTYFITVTAGQVMAPGDFFVFYDFGIIGFGSSVSAPGTVPPSFAFGEHPTFPETVVLPGVGTVTVEQTDRSNVIVSYGQLGITPLPPGTTITVTLEGDIAPLQTVAFVGRGTSAVGGQPNANLTRVQVPFPSAVPEPSSLFLLGIGLAGAAVVGRRTIRQ
jgi:PEP-CTERM motif-containing protein